MHILELPTFFPPYGGLFCLEQSKALSKAGHEVRIVSSVMLSGRVTPKAYFSYPCKSLWHEMEGIVVLSEYPRSIPGMYRRNINHWLNSVLRLCEQYIEVYGMPDIIHAHVTHWAGVAAMKLKEKYGIPYIITEHCSITNLEAQHITPSSWQAEEGCKALDQACAVIHVSEENMYSTRDIIKTISPCHIISNIIDTDFYCPPSENPSSEPFKFFCAAVMLQGKGYDILLNAFRKVCEQTNFPIELHIAGRGTDGRKMRNMISDDIKDKVITYGHLDKYEVRRLMHKCHNFVLATRSESQGLVIMEALSCGLPYISTEAIPGCLRLDGSSTIVPIDDADAFAQAMLDAINKENDDIAARIQRHNYIKEMASSSVFVSKFNELLLLNGK